MQEQAFPCLDSLGERRHSRCKTYANSYAVVDRSLKSIQGMRTAFLDRLSLMNQRRAPGVQVSVDFISRDRKNSKRIQGASGNDKAKN